MNRLAIALAILTTASSAPAADTSTGDRTIDAYFQAETTRLADRCLADIQTLDDWKARRGEYREQLFEMLGLSPRPKKHHSNRSSPAESTTPTSSSKISSSSPAPVSTSPGISTCPETTTKHARSPCRPSSTSAVTDG